jgi:hypothetical protein
MSACATLSTRPLIGTPPAPTRVGRTVGEHWRQVPELNVPPRFLHHRAHRAHKAIRTSSRTGFAVGTKTETLTATRTQGSALRSCRDSASHGGLARTESLRSDSLSADGLSAAAPLLALPVPGEKPGTSLCLPRRSPPTKPRGLRDLRGAETRRRSLPVLSRVEGRSQRLGGESSFRVDRVTGS